MNNNLIYAGIGSRETPKPILNIMQSFAYSVCKTAVLRSGGASGADTAFYKGAKLKCDEKGYKRKDKIEVYLPWNGFNKLYDTLEECHSNIPHGAFMLAEKYHSNYRNLTDGGKNLMARNCMQVLGRLLNDPVDFIVCYTNDGKASGGTGQALRIAEDRNILIYNLYYKDAYKFCKDFINN